MPDKTPVQRDPEKFTDIRINQVAGKDQNGIDKVETRHLRSVESLENRNEIKAVEHIKVIEEIRGGDDKGNQKKEEKKFRSFTCFQTVFSCKKCEKNRDHQKLVEKDIEREINF